MNTRFRRPDLSEAIAVLALFAGLFSAVLSWWSRSGLWEDEIIAVTHGLQPLPSFFVEVLRNDIHPFFYFLLLKFWSSLDFGSDSWVLMSSLVTALGSAGVVAIVAYWVGGRVAAIWATALFSVLPSFSWAASNLRMYALMPSIAVGCWYVNREALRCGTVRSLLFVVLLQSIESYTHAIGFFFAAFFALAALIGQRRELTRSLFLRWAGAQLVSLLILLPVVASALLRGTEPLGQPTLWGILDNPAQIISFAAPAALAPLLGTVTFLALVAFAMFDKEARVLVLVVPCGVLAVCTLVSLMGKAMFKAPVFSANLIPFLALGAGLSIARCKAAQYCASFCILILAASLWSGNVDRHPLDAYKLAAYYILHNARPGDQVVVPSGDVFWGIMRYGVAARWGTPLAVAPLNDNPQWTALKNRIGLSLSAMLGLVPLTDHIDHHGLRYIIGRDLLDEVPPCGRFWAVHRNNYERRGQEVIHFPYPMRQDLSASFDDELTISLLTAANCGS